ncbi:MAG TPA: hypothetical protein VLD62_10615 [Acidimicrobiia bacterium]|nr:hypothetical protein [Acidimicrobiia bacterium]
MGSRSIAVTAALLLVLGVLNAAPAIADDQVGVVDTTTGEWHLRPDDGIGRSFYYGNPGDYPFMGDWDCDGVDTPGLYRQSDGYAYLRNANTQGIADIRFYFGDPGDVPLAGDWNGDGCDTLGLYRPSEGKVYLHNTLGSGDTGLGAAELEFYWGNPGDEPFAADTDGDGIDEIGLYRRSDATVFLKWDNTPGVADDSFVYGNPADQFVGGDFDGDGTDTVAIYRPATAEFHLRNTNTPGIAETTHRFGIGDQTPVAGDFAIPTPAWEDRAWTETIIDDQPLAGRWASLTTGPTGNPIMAYGYIGPWTEWAPWESLVIAACRNRTCTDTAINRTGAPVGDMTSVDLGADGNPVIAYEDNMILEGVIAFCEDAECRTVTRKTVMSTSQMRGALEVRTSGLPILAASTSNGLVVTACGDGRCDSFTSEALRSSSGYTPVDITSLGDRTLVLVSWGAGRVFSDGVLLVMQCHEDSCRETATEVAQLVASTPFIEAWGQRPAITTRADGVAIAYSLTRKNEEYRAIGSELWLAVCDDGSCSDLSKVRIAEMLLPEPQGDWPQELPVYADIEIAGNGSILIAHRNPVSGGLQITSCGDESCVIPATIVLPATGMELAFTVDPYGVPIVISRESDGLTLLRSPN